MGAILRGVRSGALESRIERGEAVVAGVLSGTSADGIDVALARFVRRGERLILLRALAGGTLPFPVDLGRRVRSVLDGEPCDLRDAALLDRDLGRAFGRAVGEVAARAGLAVELVGSHGQTVYHHDDREPSGPATLQLGDGCELAEELGCDVVSDFRARDVAAGGGGAPLSAYGDEVLFEERPLALLNLGGMANLTWLGEGHPPLAFDTGPAGALLDGLARRHLRRGFDPGGEAAAAGRSDPARVAQALRHPFFGEAPPKSTGRDTFGEAWIDSLGWEGRPEDLLADGVELVAAAVAGAVRKWLPERPRRLVVAGGGLANRTLIGALEGRLGLPLVSSAEFGVDPNLREALVFAALAARFALGEGSTAPSATGAAPGRILGKWSPGIR